MRRTRPLPSNTAQSTVSRGVLGFAILSEPPSLSETLSQDGRRRATPRGQTKHQAGRAGGGSNSFGGLALAAGRRIGHECRHRRDGPSDDVSISRSADAIRGRPYAASRLHRIAILPPRSSPVGPAEARRVAPVIGTDPIIGATAGAKAAGGLARQR